MPPGTPHSEEQNCNRDQNQFQKHKDDRVVRVEEDGESTAGEEADNILHEKTAIHTGACCERPEEDCRPEANWPSYQS